MNDAYIVFFISFLITWTAASLNPLPDFCPDRADSNRFESPGNSMHLSSPNLVVSQQFSLQSVEVLIPGFLRRKWCIFPSS